MTRFRAVFLDRRGDVAPTWMRRASNALGWALQTPLILVPILAAILVSTGMSSEAQPQPLAPAPAPGGATNGQAAAIAAAILRARADACTAAGDSAVAAQLRRIARGLDRHVLTVTQADGLVQLIDHLPPASVAAAPQGPAGAPGPGAATTGPAAPMDAHQTLGLIQGHPAGAPAPRIPEPAPVTAQASAAPDIVARILAITRSTDDKPALIMIDAGAKKGIHMGQDIIVRRGNVCLVKAVVQEVKPDESICVLIPGTWANAKVEIHNDDLAVVLP